MPLTAPRDDERGVTLVLVTASLMFIFGLAAIVVDGGLGWSERRQAQSAADFASLAALQFAISCDVGGAGCSIDEAAQYGAEEAEDVVEGNLPGRYQTADWDACTDPDRPAEYSIVADYECVSYTDNFDKSRVVLPVDTIETTFGRVIGVANLSVQALAEAEQHIEQSAAVIPLTPTGAGGPHSCLFSNQAPQTVPPCDGGGAGFSGYIDLALYGNDDPEFETPSTCEQGTPLNRIAINLVLGADHILAIYDGDIAINDHEACPDRSEQVDELVLQPTEGAVLNALQPGLVGSVTISMQGQPASPRSVDGRLLCGGASADCESVRGRNVDHTGLFDYLLPGQCPGTNDHASMVQCLVDWPSSGAGVIFDEDIADHPRFVAVPVFTSAPSGPGAYRIAGFVPYWLETIYTNCTANRCRTIHTPGENGTPPACPSDLEAEPDTTNCGWDETGNTSVQGLTALRIEPGMLPASIRDSFPGTSGTRTLQLTR